MLKEREEFLAKVQREADEILESARVRAERMVQRTEIVREAQHLATKTVEEARDESRRLRLEAEDYCDQKLASFEIVLERTIKTVQAGREKLREPPAGRSAGRPAQCPRRRRRRGRRRSLLRPGPVVTQSSPTWAGDPFSSWSSRVTAAGARITRREEHAARWPIYGGTGSCRCRAEGVAVDLDLDSVPGGIVAAGSVEAPWAGECRRCLGRCRGASGRGPGGLRGDARSRRDLSSCRRPDRPRAAGARRCPARVAAGAALCGRLPGAVPRVRGQPQPNQLHLCGRPPVDLPVGGP